MNSNFRFKRKGFNLDNFEITKREIIASVSIIAIMLLIGFLIAGKMKETQMDKNEIYNKAVKIESTDLFQYGMETNIGNAFVYGDLIAVDTVTYSEISGSYMYIEKVEERYTRHTRTKTVDGKTETETYYTWDFVSSENKKCNEISFCNIIFQSSKINMPSTRYIETIKESMNVRYKYYVVDAKNTGTIFTELKDNTIAGNTDFYKDKNIDETVEYLESYIGVVNFWILWIVFIGLCVFGFYYLENEWLE